MRIKFGGFLAVKVETAKLKPANVIALMLHDLSRVMMR